jgi:hypothetical protein
MSRLDIMRGAFTNCFRSPRLWLIQFFANVILFALLVAWLLVPVASNLHVAFNFVFAALLIVTTLTLHSGTLNACVDRLRGAPVPLWPAFRRALRHILPVASCIAAFCLLCLLVNAPGFLQTAFPVLCPFRFVVISLCTHSTTCSPLLSLSPAGFLLRACSCLFSCKLPTWVFVASPSEVSLFGEKLSSTFHTG